MMDLGPVSDVSRNRVYDTGRSRCIHIILRLASSLPLFPPRVRCVILLAVSVLVDRYPAVATRGHVITTVTNICMVSIHVWARQRRRSTHANAPDAAPHTQWEAY